MAKEGVMYSKLTEFGGIGGRSKWPQKGPFYDVSLEPVYHLKMVWLKMGILGRSKWAPTRRIACLR